MRGWHGVIGLLTPYDIYKKEFRRVFRGYDEQEVDEFLDQVAAVLKELYRENEELRTLTQSIQEGQPALPRTKISEEIQNEVARAQKQVEELIDAASVRLAQRAEDVLLEAEARLGGLVARVEEETERLLREAEERLGEILVRAAEKLKLLSFGGKVEARGTKQERKIAVGSKSRRREV